MVSVTLTWVEIRCNSFLNKANCWDSESVDDKYEALTLALDTNNTFDAVADLSDLRKKTPFRMSISQINIHLMEP